MILRSGSVFQLTLSGIIYFFVLVILGIGPSFSKAIAETAPVEPSASKLFKFSASGRIRGEALRNKSLNQSNDDLRYIWSRFRIGLEFLPEETTSIFLQPQFSHGFGQTETLNQNLTTVTNTSGTTENIPTATTTQTSGSTYDPALSIHQAFIEHKFCPEFEIKLGRQEMNYGDQLVVGPSDWDNVGRSFDALLIRSKWGPHSIHGWAVKNIDRNIKTNAEGDQDFYGLYSMWSIHDYLKALDIYGFFLRDPSTANHLKIYTGGLRAKSQVGQFDYRFESTLEKGRRAGNEMDGLQADLELGYGFTIFQAFRVSLEGFFSSKDYHQLYPTGHKWLGYLDLFGRRNISGMAEHIHADISSTTGIDFDLHHFVRSDTSSAVYKLDGLSLLGTGTKTDSRDVGTELDLTGSLKITKVLALKSGGSVFFPGQYLESEVGSRKAMKTFIEIEAKY